MNVHFKHDTHDLLPKFDLLNAYPKKECYKGTIFINILERVRRPIF